MLEFDTIAAISTPMGEGAIAIVRLSGEEAITIADRIFKSVIEQTINRCSFTYYSLRSFH